MFSNHISNIQQFSDPSIRFVLGDSNTTENSNFHQRQSSTISLKPNNKNSIFIVWYRGHDLRVHDHAALDVAVSSGAIVIALYVLERGAETDGNCSYMKRTTHQSQTVSSTTNLNKDDNKPPSTIYNISDETSWGPMSPNAGFALGRIQRWYLHHSLSVLQDNLQKLGITLVLRKVDCAEDTSKAIISVAKALGAQAVLWNKRHKPRAYPVDSAVKTGLTQHNITAHDLSSELLVDPDNDSFSHYDEFHSYSRYWLNEMKTNSPPRPNDFIQKDNVNTISKQIIHNRLLNESYSINTNQDHPTSNCTLPNINDLELLVGLNVDGDQSPGDIKSIGCIAAQTALQSFLSEERFGRFSFNEARRDGMVLGSELATSRLSPYVRFGELSPRVLFYSIIDAAAEAKRTENTDRMNAAKTFLKNMSIREFGYHMLSRYPSAACKPIVAEFEAFPWAEDKNRVYRNAWEAGTTGYPLVDAAMRQLLKEGWLHNRMRFLAASFFCKYLLLPWPIGAAHMVRTLVDGDEACNSLGWQWTVGCNADSFPFSTLVNPLSIYTNTRSVATAANYVRTYVPELAKLPDSLILTPWKVTPADCIKYDFQLVPLTTYNNIHYESNISIQKFDTSVKASTFYPNRIVTCKYARLRARNAMDIMRRIVSAQRQCRTFIVEQFPNEYVKHIQTGQRMICEGKPILSMIADTQESNSSVSISLISDVTGSQNLIRRPAEAHPTNESNRPSKRRRTLGKALKTATPSLKKRNNLTSPETLASKLAGDTNNITDVGSTCTGAEEINHATKTKASNNTTVTVEKIKSTEARRKSASTNRKRPRTFSPQKSRQTDKRVSVRSLVLPTNFTPQPPIGIPIQPNGTRTNGLEPMIQNDGHTALAMRACTAVEPSINSTQPSLNLANGATSSYPYSMANVMMQTPNLGLSSIGHTSNHVPREVLDNHLQTSTPYENHESNGGGTHGVVTPNIQQQQQQAQLGIPSPVVTSRETHMNEAPLQPIQSIQPIQPIQPSAVPISSTIMTDDGMNSSHNLHIRNNPMTSMYHTNAQTLPLVPTTYHPIQTHNNQIVVSYRQPQSAIPMNHSTHVQNQAQHQTGAQNFFQTSINMQPNQGHAQSVVWYPIQPYMDLHNPAIQGTVLPQAIQHVTRTPAGLPFNYSFGRTNGMNPSTETNMNMNGNNLVCNPNNNLIKRGPSNPMEREAIARRMAAMDYHDETYGGKHWEQWQAIALHLLNQYEFSEDTDRETSKAYVRLCVLKDELRETNPSGPRVTVHHCKEVFRILCLPVTGEWDRRGHGGVRGPYCYGCVKRRGARLPK